MIPFHLEPGTEAVPYGCAGACRGRGCGERTASGSCRLLTAEAAAALLSFSATDLKRWRASSNPSFPKSRQDGLYDLDSLLRWVDERGRMFYSAPKSRRHLAALTPAEAEAYFTQINEYRTTRHDLRAKWSRQMFERWQRDRATQLRHLATANAVRRAQPVSAKARARMRQAKLVFDTDPATAEYRAYLNAKRSQTMKQRYEDPAYRARITAAQKAAASTPERQASRSKASKAMWASKKAVLLAKRAATRGGGR